MKIEALRRLSEAAEYLEDDRLQYRLQSLARQWEEQRFVMPVIGQFNAGKSQLLNSLFRQRILPTKGTESTCYPAYFRYGDRQRAWLLDAEGGRTEIALPQVAELHQQRVSDRAVSRIEVELPERMLEKGLVLVDTPGFNTVHAAHEEMTRSVLPDALAAIYVLAKGLTDFDRTLIRQLHRSGLELLFVRTKLDEIHRTEESADELIAAEREELQRLVGGDVSFYPLSTQQQALNDERWSSALDRLRQDLELAFVDQSRSRLEASLAALMVKWAEACKERMQERIAWLERQLAASGEETERMRGQLQDELQAADREWRTRRQSLEREAEPLAERSCAELRRIRIEAEDGFRHDTRLVRQQGNLPQAAQALAIEHIDRFWVRAEQLSQVSMQHLVRDIANVPDYGQLIADGEHAVHWLKLQMDEVAQRLDRAAANATLSAEQRDELALAIEETKRLAAASSRELNEHGPFRSQLTYVEGDKSVSESMARIGSVLDWLTLLIPGEGAIAAGNKAAKAAKLPKIADALRKGGKIAQAAKRIDAAKDVLYVAKNVRDSVKQNVPEGQTSFLDVITIEFWMRKAGEAFDTPPRYEVDREAEAAYHARRSQLEHNHQLAVRQELQQLELLQLLRSKEERAHKERELQRQHRLALEKQLAAERESLKQEAMRKYEERLQAMFARELQDVCAKAELEIRKAARELTERAIAAAAMDYQERRQTIASRMESLSVDGRAESERELRHAQRISAGLADIASAGAASC